MHVERYVSLVDRMYQYIQIHKQVKTAPTCVHVGLNSTLCNLQKRVQSHIAFMVEWLIIELYPSESDWLIFCV